MYKYLRQYNKKIMAVLGAFLMIVFVLPSTVGRNQANPIYGTINGQPLRISELESARNDWDLLSRSMQTVIPELGGQSVPLAVRLGSTDAQQLQQSGPIAYSLINENPDTFALLRAEAVNAGFAVSPERARRFLDNEITNRPTDPNAYDRAVRAIQSYLVVQDSFNRVGSVAKVSQVAQQRELVRRATTLKAEVVVFDAESAIATAIEPTEEQIVKQFEAFADIRSGTTADTNPFRFGYLIPDRVKVQYISYTQDQLRSIVRAKRTDREWEVLARKYYLEHPAEFAEIAPATTSPATDPAISPTAPVTATRPFDDVRLLVTDKVMQPEVDRLNSAVRESIGRRLSEDFTAATAGEPDTVPSGAYAEHAYLERIAGDIQVQYGFLPTVTSLLESWTPVEQLPRIPGIGSARREQTTFVDQVSASAALAAEPTLGAIKTLEMSRPFTAADGSTYFFRIAAAEKTHKPTTVDDPGVREQVVRDLKLAARMETISADARKLLDAAVVDGLTTAAASMGKSIQPVGPIPSPSDFRLAFMPIPGFDPAGERVTFAEQAFDLLGSDRKDPSGRPIGLIELPGVGQVVVCMITETIEGYDPRLAGLLPTVVGEAMRREALHSVESDWFSHDAAVERTGYQQVIKQ